MMTEQNGSPVILYARRAYVFHRDDLPLAHLCTQPVMERIRQTFRFQVASITQPMPTFGPVPPSLPPGVVYNFGVYIPDQKLPYVPIRFIHFEPYRIVIDISDRSSLIDNIFGRLREILEDMRGEIRIPMLLKPREILDYSELVVRAGIPLRRIFTDQVSNIFDRTLRKTDRQASLVLVPSVTLRLVPAREPYPGTEQFDHRMALLDLRQGAVPEEGVYFSAAPLDTETHRRYLEDLIRSLREG